MTRGEAGKSTHTTPSMTCTRRESARALSASTRSYGWLAMLSATLCVKMMEIGHSTSSGASSQSSISPNSELGGCGRSLGVARESGLRRRSLITLLQAVAETAHGHDAQIAVLELLAQAVHIDLDGIVRHLLAPAAQVVDELFLADQATGLEDEDLEQADLARRELHHLAVDAHDAVGLVVFEAAEADAPGLTGAAPRERAHARLELGQFEGLGQIIVGTRIEPAYAVLDAVLRGQDQHRQRRLAHAQPFQHLDAGQARQA